MQPHQQVIVFDLVVVETLDSSQSLFSRQPVFVRQSVVMWRYSRRFVHEVSQLQSVMTLSYQRVVHRFIFISTVRLLDTYSVQLY